METTINNPIQSLWVGQQLSKVEQLCIQSFIDHGHSFHLYAYEQISNVPKGATLMDARSIIAENAVFPLADGFAKGSYAGFADQFRLLLIQKKGGWWVDMDVICLKPFDLQQEFVICSSYEGEWGSLVNNCIFKAPSDSFFLKFCLDEIAKTDVKKMNFGDAGPFLFQRMVRELNLEDKVVPYHYFNPIFWRYLNDLILGEMNALGKIKEVVRPLFKPETMPGRRIKTDSYAVHFWNEIWRTHGLEKNATYSYSSLFERLKRKPRYKIAMATPALMVSICMPAYNAELFIKDAIDSVIAQTYKNWELIIVDDGSSDRTGDIARSIIDPRIKVLYQQNKGQCAAANEAFANSSGNLIKFFDADDILSPAFIENQVLRLGEDIDVIASAGWGRFYNNDLSTFRAAPKALIKITGQQIGLLTR